MSKPRRIPDWRSEPESLRPFADIQLIAVDLDGTFVGADGAVLDQVQSIQLGLRPRRWGRPGVRLTYATGRSLMWVQQLERELHTKIPSGTPLVLYNGSVVVEAVTGVVLHQQELPIGALEPIVEMAVPQGASVFAYSGPRELLEGTEPELVAAWSRDAQGRPGKDVNGIDIRWDVEDLSLFKPVAVLVTAPQEEANLTSLAKALATVKGVSVTAGSSSYLEIRPENSNKATGLDASISRLGVQRGEVLALGDSDNDVEMLEWAGVAVVVAGATTRAQEASDYITRFGPSQGVLEVLRTVKYARRYFQAARSWGGNGRQGVDV